MNEVIKSFASEIPEHLFYTALPQLLSRVVHKNVETSKNVARILRTVLAKYPLQSMWSCGWLRFSKSEEKKKAGDVSLVYARKFSFCVLFNPIITWNYHFRKFSMVRTKCWGKLREANKCKICSTHQRVFSNSSSL